MSNLNFDQANSIFEFKSIYPDKDALLNWCLEDISTQEPLSADIHQNSDASLSSFSSPQSDITVADVPHINATANDLFSAIMSPFSSTDDTLEMIDQWNKLNQEGTENLRVDKPFSQPTENDPNQLVANAFANFNYSLSDQQPTIKDNYSYHTDPTLKKISHNAIERRYRNNINERISELKNAVPALYMAKVDKNQKSHSSDENSDDEQESSEQIIDGVEIARKLNKATILRKATEYIYHLKRTVAMVEQESQILQYVLAQMPEGTRLLSSFNQQRLEMRKAEHERRLCEQKLAKQREKQMRERVLRERAVERASVAKLLPKRERKPYHRRTKQEMEKDKRKK
ncbi:helix-loop-helix DNA-binding domain-containing protein [Choanephora cucurbitarum]|nr:helix-loop-helix DNA-binding domain-containing protein [Choanephora cucurbitarum]